MAIPPWLTIGQTAEYYGVDRAEVYYKMLRDLEIRRFGVCWKLASTYALLSIAEAFSHGQQTRPPSPDPTGAAGQQTGELLTVADVAEMTRLSAGTLRYWRTVGGAARRRSSLAGA